MNLKTLLLATLSFATVTACAHPMEKVIEARAEARRSTLEHSTSISAGACDDVGQYIPSDSASHVSLSQEASAAPARR